MQGNIKEVKMDTSRYHTDLEDLARRREAGIWITFRYLPRR